jgi:hypothetical protein
VRRRGVDGPPNSVLEAVVAAEADGAAISPDEGVHMCLLVFNGGHETTTNLIAVGTHGLLRHRDEFARLAELDNSTVNVAIEEIIRYVSPLQLQGRRTTSDMDLPSGHLTAGTEVVLCQASANRDEQAFDEPDRLHLNRRPNAHVAFGLGVHSCLGNQLARLEARVVLPRLARRLPHLELDGAPNVQPQGPIPGPAEPPRPDWSHRMTTQLDNYYDRLADRHYGALWRMSGALTRAPVTVMVPHLWQYAEARDLLTKAGSLVTPEEADRRVIAFDNPGTRPGRLARATDTLWAALQLVLPGERAPVHRHTPAALRFVIEGHGGWTDVDGTRYEMAPGDVIRTPNWTWHGHGHAATATTPMIWLDGLDLPLRGRLLRHLRNPRPRRYTTAPRHGPQRRRTGNRRHHDDLCQQVENTPADTRSLTTGAQVHRTCAPRVTCVAPESHPSPHTARPRPVRRTRGTASRRSGPAGSDTLRN